VDSIPAVSSIGARGVHPGGPSLSPGRGAAAARDFEADLIASLLDSLERSFVGLGDQDTTAGSGDYRYLGTQAVGSALAEKGGLGIAAMIARHLPHESKLPVVMKDSTAQGQPGSSIGNIRR